MKYCELYIESEPFLVCRGLSFEPGRVYCIRGRSGTGKTSFLRAMAGIPSVKCAGDPILYNGVGGGTVEPELGLNIGFLQQAAPLWPHLTAFANAWMPYAARFGLRYVFERKRTAQERAREFLETLELGSSILRRFPYSLSGGERQRVALASLLVFDTPCILVDEPTSGLDRVSVDAVCRILDQQAGLGKLVIVTSHDLDLLQKESWYHLAVVENEVSGFRFNLSEVAA